MQVNEKIFLSCLKYEALPFIPSLTLLVVTLMRMSNCIIPQGAELFETVPGQTFLELWGAIFLCNVISNSSGQEMN